MRERIVAATLVSGIVFIAGAITWFAVTILPRELQVIGLVAILIGALAFLADTWQNLPKEK